MLVASLGMPGPSSSGSSNPIRSSHRPPRPPRWKPRRSSSPHLSSPSSGILSLLATLVASSSAVNGSPAPLPFLCPSVDVKSIPSSQIDPRDVSPPPKLETRSNPSNVARKVPDMFTQYPDGIWRKVDAYTLYGSTVCADCREPTASATPSGDAVVDADAAATTTSSYDIRNSLPPGWIPSTPSSPSRTTLILALSLVLAFFICFFIVGCLFWRKQKRRKHREDDVEIKGKKRRRSEGLTTDEEREAMVEKEARVKQKIWARATARWKANARFSARQRRGKRLSTKPSVPDAAEDRMEQLEDASSLHGVSRNPSLLSRATSISSLHTLPPSVTMAPSIPERVNLSIDSLPIPTVIPTSPPAYHQRNTITAQTDLSLETEDYSKQSVDGNRLTGSSASTSSDSDEHPLSLHAAHVATDDKATLARLANLASAPSIGGAETEALTSLPPSVPLWEDGELTDLELENSLQEEEQNSLPYPLPPSKGKMAAPNFYDYPCAFEEIDSFEEQGPSAPPFEEGSTHLPQDLAVLSAPPLNDVPSAPPLDFDMIPSAPPLVDEHCISNQSIRPSGWVNTHLSQSDLDTNQLCLSDASRSDPPVQGPVARDGTLPVYKP